MEGIPSPDSFHQNQAENTNPNSDYVIAKQLLAISEVAGEIVDDLYRRFWEGTLRSSDFRGAALEVRRIVFLQACDALDVSERARQYAIQPDREG